MDIGIVLGIFIGWPFLTLVPAVVLALMYARCRRPIVLVADVRGVRARGRPCYSELP